MQRQLAGLPAVGYISMYPPAMARYIDIKVQLHLCLMSFVWVSVRIVCMDPGYLATILDRAMPIFVSSIKLA
jgi:hypothetical protein